MIEIYTLKGEFVKEEELSRKKIEAVHRMKIRCTLKNGESLIGYCSSAEMLTGENIELSCAFDVSSGFKDVKIIPCEEISKIEAMLHSNPRCGSKVNFSFEVDRNKEKKEETTQVVIPDFLKLK